jgi:hypothetical protein
MYFSALSRSCALHRLLQLRSQERLLSLFFSLRETSGQRFSKSEISQYRLFLTVVEARFSRHSAIAADYHNSHMKLALDELAERGAA